MNDLENIRNEYSQKYLSKKEMYSNPIGQFDLWFNEALESSVHEPTACTLSTANKIGRPSGRIILLKGFSSEGFRFFTNYESRKGKELLENPFASLTFFWKELERQVRIEGTVEKTSSDISDSYFDSRPVGSKIGAWSSPQSQIIPNRQFLEQSEMDFKSKFENNINRPNHWGGFTIEPDAIEFWQGRPSRLHDRLLYSLVKGDWKIERLAP